MFVTGDSLSTVEVFDPIIGRWQLAEAMSMLRSRVGVAVMRDRLYAFGGYNGYERLSTVEVFDPQKRAWSRVSPMHFKRRLVHIITAICIERTFTSPRVRSLIFQASVVHS